MSKWHGGKGSKRRKENTKAYLENYPRGKFRLLPHNNQDIAEKLKNNTSTLNEAALLDFIYQIFNFFI